ncbi:polysaccharide biosynthesis tyrosine autokinase [Kocuria palustris]|uniref:polysaccharide biosynthesis tyrosine autokinase n=1 Tax=Kocuria palustris TaxID=71999 RepID=UPI002468919B|nr:polysaccharide biosynthesis tyrosine autokinase [Kocuria palustris]MDH5151487.1 polysaccharide biosynthesis tyrosine autokinase [Kocuria palustris]
MTQPLIAPDLDATPSIADQLRAGLGTLIRNWKVILGIILACLVIAGIVTALMPKTYSATSKAMVIAGGATSLANYEAAQSLAGSKAATYGAAVGSPEVAKLAQEDLGGIEVAGVSADVPPGTTEINVTGRASTPEDAVVVADTYAEALSEHAGSIEAAMAQGQEVPTGEDAEELTDQELAVQQAIVDGNLVQIVPLSSATPPSAPSSPDLKKNLLIGLAAGIVISLLYLFLRHAFDRKIRSSEGVEKRTGLPLLGAVPVDSRLSSSRQLIPLSTSRKDARGWATAEALRMLRTNLAFSNVDNPPRSIVVSSSISGEGKSAVTANLAAALAAAGESTIVIDADLRRPVQHHFFGVPGGAGLTDVLRGAATLDEVLQPGPDSENLFVLTAGRTPPNPSELLGSDTMRQLIQELSRDHIVLLDTPPVLPVTDAAVLARSSDGVILVAQAGRTNLDDLQKAVERLRSLSAPLLGVVVNRAPRKGAAAKDYGHYSNAYYYNQTETPAADQA